jgi:hypothetical protein
VSDTTDNLEVKPMALAAVEPAAVTAPGKPMPTLAQARAGGKKGGSRPKASVPMTGLGASSPSVIDLATGSGRLAVLQAAAEAVALGRCSSATVTALVAVVRAATEVVKHDQDELLAELERRVAELVEGRTVTVR